MSTSPRRVTEPKTKVLKIIAEAMLPSTMVALPYSARPVIWKDMEAFADKHARTGADLVYDLVMQSKFGYNEAIKKSTVVPFDLELLMRLYDVSPSSVPWRLPNVREVFDLLYGPAVRTFSSDSGKWTEVEFKTAELMCGRRYARGLGRSDTASYRWVQSEGKVTRRLSNILGKIVEICANEVDPRERFESIVGPILAMRGIDIDQETPMPTMSAVRRTTAGRRVSVSEDEGSAVAPEYLGGAFS